MRFLKDLESRSDLFFPWDNKENKNNNKKKKLKFLLHVSKL